jgi:hypothetical protein
MSLSEWNISISISIIFTWEYTMALYVRNDEVNAMADLLAKLTGKSKTDVVKEALSDAIERVRKKPSLGEAITALQAKVTADGFCTMPDQKDFSDELSGRV